jgi:D-glycero-D-manno-heptose 1,7-bisphosphate phosphatase
MERLPMSEPRPAVFLDRDGVVNEVVFRDDRPASPRSLAEFVWAEGIQDAVKQLKMAGLPVFIVTNQPDVARGKLDPAVLTQIAQKLYQTLAIDDIRVCPHDDRDDCTCRKPKPGMLISLAAQWHLDLNRSFLIGDSWKDSAAGQQAGCCTILLDRPYNQEAESDYRVDSLQAAIRLILNLISKHS